MAYQNAWRSARLVYKSIESPEHDAFIHEQNIDPDALANSNSSYLKPPTKKDSMALQQFIMSQLIAVAMCLPATDPAVIAAKGPSPTAPPAATPAAGAAPAAAPAAAVPDVVPIGMMFIMAPKPGYQHHRNGVIGIGVTAPYQGKGYGTESLEWLMHWGFRIAGLHKLNIECFSYNTGARRLYERLGFQVEGVRRENVWFDGAWHDEIELGILEREWRASREGEGNGNGNGKGKGTGKGEE